MVHKPRIHSISLDTDTCMISINRHIPVRLRVRLLVHWLKCYLGEYYGETENT